MKSSPPPDREDFLVRIDRDRMNDLRAIAAYEGCSIAYLVRHAVAVEVRWRHRLMEEIDAQGGGCPLPVRGRS